MDRYFDDPRYLFEFGDYHGHISFNVREEEKDKYRERDDVFLQTFGLGYENHEDRVVVVYLRYLSSLSSDHQLYWSTYELDSERCRMCEDYYRNTIEAEWTIGGSLYVAFIEEQKIINQMCSAIGWPHFFRKTFEDKRPKEFSLFVRPTKKHFHEFVHTVDKMLSDNINADFFPPWISRTKFSRIRGVDAPRERGTLSMFEEWLKRSIRTDEGAYDHVINPLKKVREMRRHPAHAISDVEYDKKYYELQDTLLEDAYGSLRTFRLLLANHPEARRVEVPNWLFEAKFRRY